MGADLATLSLEINNAQAISDAQATGAALEEMGAKGEGAALKLVRSSSPVEAAIRRQADTARFLAASQTEAIAVNERLGTSHAKLAQYLAHAEAAQRAMTLKQIEAIAMNNAMNSTTQTTGATTAAATRSMGMFSAMNAEASGHVGEHSINLGRMERMLSLATERMTGMNPVIGLVSTSLLKFGIGTIETAGILGGLYAITVAWSKLTEEATKAAKAQEEGLVKLNAALLTHVQGAAGDLGEMMTAGYGRLSDIDAEKKSRGSWGGAFRTGDFMSYNMNPGDREKNIRKLDDEARLVALAIKSAETDLQIANAKQFASSVSTPYNRAMSRGTSIAGFYSEALAAEAKLTELAKSGTFEVRDAAIQALGAMDQIITRHKLIGMGLATGPHQISGIESGVYLGAAGQESGDLQAGIMSAALHGADVASFAGKISKLGGTLDKARPTDLADITALAKLRDDILLLGDAARMADAKTPAEQENIASAIRSRRGFTSMAGPLVNAEAQRAYGETLAAREAALKLPSAFDAVREAALKLGEGMRNAKQHLAMIRSSWSPGQIGAGIEAGATEGLASALQTFTPAGITASLVTTGINYIVSGFTDMAMSMLDGGAAARAAALAMKTMRDSFTAAVAAFKHDDLGASLAQNQVAYDQLLKQLGDTTKVWDLVMNGPGAYNATAADLAAQKARNDATIRLQAGYAQEDLGVRLMRAQGNTAGADLLAFREKAQREMDAAKLTHPTDTNDAAQNLADKIYLDTLATVQNNELLAYQNGLLATAMRNAPTGFYGMEAYARAYVTPRSPYSTDPGPSTGAGGPTIHGRVTGGAQTIILQVDGKTLTSVVVKNVDQFASSTNGAGSSRSDALNRYPA